MNREAFEHLVRAAGSIVGDDRVLVIGSQSILGSFSEDDLPSEITLSREVDIAFFDDSGGHKADLLDGSIGEESIFEDSFGYYAQGVSETTAVLPQGWRDRLVAFTSPNTGGVTAMCLEVHDLWVAKLAAARSTDVAYCEALVRNQLVDPATLRERLASTVLARDRRELAEGIIERVLRDDAAPPGAPARRSRRPG